MVSREPSAIKPKKTAIRKSSVTKTKGARQPSTAVVPKGAATRQTYSDTASKQVGTPTSKKIYGSDTFVPKKAAIGGFTIPKKADANKITVTHKAARPVSIYNDTWRSSAPPPDNATSKVADGSERESRGEKPRKKATKNAEQASATGVRNKRRDPRMRGCASAQRTKQEEDALRFTEYWIKDHGESLLAMVRGSKRKRPTREDTQRWAKRMKFDVVAFHRGMHPLLVTQGYITKSRTRRN